MIDLGEVFRAVAAERTYQDYARGPLDGRSLDVGAWLTVLRVELCEAEAAWAKGPGVPGPGNEAALVEVLQVAAVAVCCLQQHGVAERKEAGSVR